MESGNFACECRIQSDKMEDVLIDWMLEMVLGQYLQDFGGWPNLTMEKIILSLRLLDYWVECLHSRVSLSKAHKMSTSSIQEYSNPNHGNHILGDEDETEKNIEHVWQESPNVKNTWFKLF